MTRAYRRFRRIFIVGGMLGFGLAALAPAVAGRNEPRLRRTDPLVLFWSQFRNFVANEDWERLSFLVRFPLMTDWGPREKDRYAAYLVRALDAPLGEGDEAVTTRALMNQKAQITDEDLESARSDRFELGKLIFTKDNGRWTLVAVGSPKMTARAPAAPVAAPEPPPQEIAAEAEPPSETPPAVPTERPAAPAPLPTTPAVKPTAASRPALPVVSPVPAPPAVPAPKPAAAAPAASSAKPPAPPAPKAATAEPRPVPSVPAPAQPAAPSIDPDFVAFWTDFRLAVMYKDMKALKALTRFPFETKGRLEEDRVKKYSAREFESVYPRMMETDPGLSPMKDTMRELVARLEAPFWQPAEEPRQARIGVFVFTKTRDGWLFTRALI